MLQRACTIAWPPLFFFYYQRQARKIRRVMPQDGHLASPASRSPLPRIDHTTATDTSTTTTLESSSSHPKAEVVLKKTALTAYLPVFYEVQAVRDERAGEALTYNPMRCDGVV